MKPVIAVSRAGPFDWQVTSSSKCCGLKPSGPPDDPAGKDLIAFRISLSVTCSEEKELGSGTVALSVGAGGCIACMASSTVSVASAGLSSEHSSRRAALILPSSILDVTALAKSNFLLPRTAGLGTRPEDPDVPAILVFIISLRLQRPPAFGGLSRTLGAKLKSFSHLAGS